MNKKFNEEMMVMARESLCLTQIDLSKKTNLTQAAISKLEKNEFELKEENVLNLANELDVTPSFFYLNDIKPDNNFIFFYRKRKLSKKILKQVESKSKMICLHLKKMHETLGLRTTKFSELSDSFKGKDPKEAAKHLRQLLNLDVVPINNLTSIIEDLGITVIELDFCGLPIDGYHVKCNSQMPVIFVNNKISGDRARFTLAHELGHLLLHEYLDEDVEDEANTFASEFLIPIETIKPDLNGLTIKKLIELKKEWKSSMQAILMEAKNTNVIPYNRYNFLWIQMSRLGFRKKEPVEVDINPGTRLKNTLKDFIKKCDQKIDVAAEKLFLSEAGFKKYYFSML